MAYIPANLACIVPSRGDAPSLWSLRGTDAYTAVRVAGYISDATKRGMKASDFVFYTDTDANPLAAQLAIVSAVSAAGAADLSDGTAITATNTD